MTSTIDSFDLHQYITQQPTSTLAGVDADVSGGDGEIIRLLNEIANQRISFDKLQVTGNVQQFDLGTLEPKVDSINTFLNSTLKPTLDNLGKETTLNQILTSISGFATETTSKEILAAIGQILAAQASSSNSSIDISTLATESTVTAINNKLDGLSKNSVSQSILTAVGSLATQATSQAIYDRLGSVLTSLGNVVNVVGNSSGGGTTIDISTLAKSADISTLVTEVQKLSTQTTTQSILTELQKLIPRDVINSAVSNELVNFTANQSNVSGTFTVPGSCYDITVINATASRATITFPHGAVIVPAYGTYNITNDLDEVPITSGAGSIAIANNVGDNSNGGDPPYIALDYRTITTS